MPVLKRRLWRWVFVPICLKFRMLFSLVAGILPAIPASSISRSEIGPGYAILNCHACLLIGVKYLGRWRIPMATIAEKHSNYARKF
jgi:hypothetical protein